MSGELSQTAAEAIELVDQLITRFAKPEYVGHLMDSDDNAGEYVRRAIEDLDAQRPADPSDSLRARLEAFSRDCVTHGDMTPAAARMLTRILEEET